MSYLEFLRQFLRLDQPSQLFPQDQLYGKEVVLEGSWAAEARYWPSSRSVDVNGGGRAGGSKYTPRLVVVSAEGSLRRAFLPAMTYSPVFSATMVPRWYLLAWERGMSCRGVMYFRLLMPSIAVLETIVTNVKAPGPAVLVATPF